MRASATPLLLAWCALRCQARAPHAPAALRIADLATARRLRALARGVDATAISCADRLLARDHARRDHANLVIEARRLAGLEPSA